MWRSLSIHAVLILLIAAALYWDTQRENKNSWISFSPVIHSTPELKHDLSQPKVSTESSAPAPVQVENGGSETTSSSEVQNYLAEVASRINRVKEYPKEAIYGEQEGTVILLIEVFSDGAIVKSEIEKATTHSLLNESALRAIQKVGALPPPPGKHSIQLHVPIQFKLN